MRTVWRITTARFAASAFTGEGARLYGGRWNPKGHAVIYTAESQSLALLEMLVQDEPLRARYVLIPAQLPADLAVSQIEASALPADWRKLGTRDALQAIGSTWLAEGTSAVLAVPSAVVPAERNYLLNPRHPDFARVILGEPKALDVDVRLLRNLRGNS
ncbi:MAG TPA: RES family NAD+ phosphorylase [Thauera sp.]|uniref:RES family NAD+ phosphorylase n=1 Tax=Thauera sp. TaxID=1905334 RepID=UPI002B5828C4|nr:RES family NAD+ phosphorylase [Thauera sp.]HRP24404.1 RES family NAD+ phosphorylase [Thauera sp.]HRP67581.1 RES family NAD+ phosphorylase [Thauera sp.]